MMWNMGSLVLGILAWCIAFAALKSKRKQLSYGCSVTSFSLCAIALMFQFLEIGRRAGMDDYAAIDDTIEGIIFAAGVLTIVTIVMNVTAMIQKNDELY